MEKVPRTIADLREFYFGVYAPLYDYLNARLRRLPQELHFEAAAALDHLMRVGELADGTKLCEESQTRHVRRLQASAQDGPSRYRQTAQSRALRRR